jgi:hypothetical protein
MTSCPLALLLRETEGVMIGLEMERCAIEIRRLLRRPAAKRDVEFTCELHRLIERGEQLIAACEHLGLQ